MAFQISPGVNVSEVDLTTVVPAVSTTAGAFVGDFAWGPAETRVLVTSETDLVNRFGKPSANAQQSSTATSFFTAANFLAYGNNLRVVRAIGANALNASSGASAGVLVKNEETYDYEPTFESGDGVFVARYPGDLGNSLNVAYCTANAALFTEWDYKNRFTVAPSTTPYVNSVGGSNDQIHMVVVDAGGLFTGVKGTVLEVYPFLSQAVDSITDDGSSNYYKTVLRNQSRYIYAINEYAALGADTGKTAANTNFEALNAVEYSLSGGVYEAPSAANTQVGWGLFQNADEVDISLAITGDAGGETSVQNFVIENIAKTRKDCIAFVSPHKDTVVNSADPVTDVSDWAAELTYSNYAFADSGWKYQFDKYNNIYRWVPLNGDMAGLCVYTDGVRDPWFSPAGYSRGVIKNVVRLAWNPNQTQRDEIYAKSINPVISVPGQGTLLFGDKTLTTQPSAFSRINVRRLFIVLEKAIANAAKYSLFELNDEFTRAQFVAIVDPFLRDVKGRRGVYDYRVVCDTTNNTPQVIDNNQFVGDIYIKPARSINYIQLNFIAVRTGVDFTEIVGGV